MTLLRMGRIHPWANTKQWRDMVRYLPSEDVMVDGITIRCNWEDHIGFLLTRSYEPYTCGLVKRLLRTGDVVVDVGANIGFLSMLFARIVGPSGKVYSYEPVSRTADMLRINIEQNPGIRSMNNIRLRERGLSNATEKVSIFIPKTASGEGLEIGQSSLLPGPERETVEQQIQVTRLDDEQVEGKIALIKCDIEGSELLFVQGASSTIARDKPVLILELNPRPDTYTVGQIVDTLRALGDYELFLIGWKGITHLIDAPNLRCDVLCAIPELHGDRLSSYIKKRVAVPAPSREATSDKR